MGPRGAGLADPSAPQAKTVRKLAALGGNVSAACPDGWTPLHAAAVRGHVAVLTRLVTLGADVSARGPSGRAPLHAAARYGRTRAVKRLLELGAPPAARDDGNLTALDHAWCAPASPPRYKSDALLSPASYKSDAHLSPASYKLQIGRTSLPRLVQIGRARLRPAAVPARLLALASRAPHL